MSKAEVESSYGRLLVLFHSSANVLEKHLSCGEKRFDRKLPSGWCDYVTVLK